MTKYRYNYLNMQAINQKKVNYSASIKENK